MVFAATGSSAPPPPPPSCGEGAAEKGEEDAADRSADDRSFPAAAASDAAECAFSDPGRAVVFGASLGTWFSVAMIAFAGAAILYDTQKILRHYPADREVAAAMSLFASLALLFWYVLRLLSRR